MARIIGGNAVYSSGTDSPLGRLYVHSVNYTEGDGVLLETPTVETWDDTDLSDDFSIGLATIPLQPTGIGFAQVLRPYSLGGKIWSKNDSWIVLASGDPVMNVANILADKVTIKLTGSKTTVELAASPTITVTVDGVLATVSAVVATNAGAKITLASAADITKPIVVTWDAASFVDDETPVAAGSLTVTPVGDYYTIVRVLNNTGSQGFSFGSYVMVDTASVNVQAEDGTSRACYRIIGPAASAVPHNHLSFGPQGQGRIVSGL